MDGWMDGWMDAGWTHTHTHTHTHMYVALIGWMRVDWLDAVMLVERIDVGDGRIDECCLHVSMDESWIIE